MDSWKTGRGTPICQASPRGIGWTELTSDVAFLNGHDTFRSAEINVLLPTLFVRA
jgi:hypothetical protein